MGIQYIEDKKLFLLNGGDDFSYAFTIGVDGHLNHLHCGARIGERGIETLTMLPLRSFAPYAPELRTEDARNGALCEFSGFGTGDFRTPSIEVLAPSGHLASEFVYRSHRIFAGRKTLAGGLTSVRGTADNCETLEIELEDKLLGVVVVLSYSVFKNWNGMARSVRVINESKESVTLEKLSSLTMDMAVDTVPWELISLSGRVACERYVERQELHQGRVILDSTKGFSSHSMNPAFALVERNATEEYGRVLGFTLLYSGNFSAEIEKNDISGLRVQFGINPENFAWVLEPGQEFQAPEVLMVSSRKGIGDMSRTFHDIFRQAIIPEKWLTAKRPVLINNWEATYFDFKRDKLVEFAKAAADCGIDMLVLDDGWFGHRDIDDCSLGDWYVNEKKLGGSMKDLVEDIKKLGMKFGLWFEPEMVSPDSDLYRAHPDWCLHIPGRARKLSRSQLVLDMSRSEVVDYLFEIICKVLGSADISYIKWDANRYLSEVGSVALSAGRQREVSHRYVLGVYDLLGRLQRRYPNLMIEGCAGGGGRFDGGMLGYEPQIWCSDNTDAFQRVFIQYGTSLFYPCSAISAHVSVSPNHQTGRTSSWDCRGTVAFAGTFGYELSLCKLSEEEKDIVRSQIEQFRRYHHLVVQGDLYRLATPFEDYCSSWLNCAKDKSEFLLSAVVPRIRIAYAEPVMTVRLQGLDEDAAYREDSTGVIYDARTLMNAGFRLPEARRDGEAWMYHFTKI